MVIGDNLGLNSVLGFQESFSASYFCRICTASKAETKQQTVENRLLVRSEESYKADTLTEEHGVKETCVFDEIPGFSVLQNAACDFMHDVLEGICRYEMAYLLDYLINNKYYFSLEHLNSRLKFFELSEADLVVLYHK